MSACNPFYKDDKKQVRDGEIIIDLENKEINIPWIQPKTMVHLLFDDAKIAASFLNTLQNEAKSEPKLAGIEKSKPIPDYKIKNEVKCALPVTWTQLMAIQKLHGKDHVVAPGGPSSATEESVPKTPGGPKM